MADLHLVYQATTREAAEAHLRQLHEKWGDKYAVPNHSWQNNREDLVTFFAFPAPTYVNMIAFFRLSGTPLDCPGDLAGCDTGAKATRHPV